MHPLRNEIVDPKNDAILKEELGPYIDYMLENQSEPRCDLKV